MRQRLAEEENSTATDRAASFQPQSRAATGARLAAGREADRQYRQERSDRYQRKIMAAQRLEIFARNLALAAGGSILAGSLIFALTQILTGAHPVRNWDGRPTGPDPALFSYLGLLGLAVAAMLASVLLLGVGRTARKLLVRRGPRHLVEVHDPGDPPD